MSGYTSEFEEFGTGVFGQWSLFGDPPPPPTPFDRVYAITRWTLIKIGHSVAPPRRADDLGGLLLATMSADNPGGYALEQKLHWRFREDRVCQEWFFPTPRVLGWVASLPIQIRPYPHGPNGGLPLPKLHLAA